MAADGTRAGRGLRLPRRPTCSRCCRCAGRSSRASCSTARRSSSRSCSSATSERWCVLLVNRRAARLFTGDGDALEETDRIEDDVHRQHDQGGWSQARYQRSVEKEKDDHLAHAAEIAFDLYKRRGVRPPARRRARGAGRRPRGAPAHLPARADRRPRPPGHRERLARRGRAPARRRRSRSTRSGASARRSTAWPRAWGAAAGAWRGSPTCSRRSTRRAWRRCSIADGFAESEAEAAIEKAIEQSADVIVVRHHDDLGPLGGIGAVLRY